MFYTSTRDNSIKLTASEAVLKGLSDDGGLLRLHSPAYQGLCLFHHKEAVQIHSDRIFRHFPAGTDLFRSAGSSAVCVHMGHCRFRTDNDARSNTSAAGIQTVSRRYRGR